jgi:hypothetical protein
MMILENCWWGWELVFGMLMTFVGLRYCLPSLKKSNRVESSSPTRTGRLSSETRPHGMQQYQNPQQAGGRGQGTREWHQQRDGDFGKNFRDGVIASAPILC